MLPDNRRSSFGVSYAQSFAAIDDHNILVLGQDDHLWLEFAPFGNVPPARSHVDANVQAFRFVDGQNVYVLGRDGNLWLQHAPFEPLVREQVDGDVAAFQPLDTATVFVLGKDGNLWLEHAGANGKFGQTPPAREQIFGPPQTRLKAIGFQAVDANTVYVIDLLQNLSLLSRSPGGNVVGPAGNVHNIPPIVVEQDFLSAGVVAIQAIDENNVLVQDTSGGLYLHRKADATQAQPFATTKGSWYLVPTGRENDELIPGSLGGPTLDIAAFQAVMGATPDSPFLVYALVRLSSGLWRFAFDFVDGKITDTGGPYPLNSSGLHIDDLVVDFQVLEPEVVILGAAGNLWLAHGPYGGAHYNDVTYVWDPPPRDPIDNDVASPIAYGRIRPHCMVLTVMYAPPGSTDGKDVSTVTYGADSTTGATVKTSSSFKAGLGVKAELGSGLTGGVSFDYSFSRQTRAAFPFKKQPMQALASVFLVRPRTASIITTTDSTSG